MMSSHKEIRERRKQQRQKQRVNTVLIIVGIAFIFLAILMTPVIRNAITPVGDFSIPEIKTRPMQNGNTAGDPDAPVVMEIYSDFGCGHCGNFALDTQGKIMDEYVASGQVYVIYNSVGSMLGHPASITTMEAAYCAGEQNMFWQYHDILYANQSALFANINRKLDKTFIAYAETLGMNTESFKQCIKQNRYNDEIQQDQLDATAAGISSTPGFLINDLMTIGAMPYSEFQTLIDTALAETQN
jgi:protein-disulfide isomerase